MRAGIRIYLLIIALVAPVVMFQNCSDVAFAPKDTSLSSLSGPYERIVSISPSGSTVKEEQNIKVLLVIDNSATMSNSQANLARNTSKLFEYIKEYNSEIKVVTTTFQDSGCTLKSKSCSAFPAVLSEVTSSHKSLEPNRTEFTTTIRQDLLSPFNPKFVINSSMSSDQKDKVLTSLSSHISSLGISGTESEAGFASFAVHLDVLDFFKPGDIALVYIITDEEDSSSIHHLVTPRSRRHVYIQEITYRPGYFYNFPRHNAQTQCPHLRENGEPAGFTTRTLGHFPTAKECQDFIQGRSPPAEGCKEFACKFWTAGSSGVLPANKSITEFCSELSIPNVSNCKSEDQSSINRTFTEEVNEYHFGISKADVSGSTTVKRDRIFAAVRDRLEDLFGDRYLVAISANLSGQACALKQGQSYDTFYARFAQVLPASAVMLQSICDTESSAGAELSRIAKRFKSTIDTSYSFRLKRGETVAKVVRIHGSSSTTMVEDVDFQISGSNFQLIGANPAQFDRIEVLVVHTGN